MTESLANVLVEGAITVKPNGNTILLRAMDMTNAVVSTEGSGTLDITTLRPMLRDLADDVVFKLQFTAEE